MIPKCCFIFVLTFCYALGASLTASDSSNSPETEFIILHNNDMHARFEQINRNGGVCTQGDMVKNKCYGGFARIAHEVRKYREEAKNGGTPVLYLNAGDIYTGTSWFTVFKDKISSAFINKLMPDAMSLGNHEFDMNVEGLIPYLAAVEVPVLVCNLDMEKEPELKAKGKLRNSTILEVNGVKIGVIGYLTPDTVRLSKPNNLQYKEEIVSINAEANKLKDQGIKIIIALGHSGYQKDQEIARACSEVDIVIGAHSHTFLDSSQPVANKDDTNPEAVRGPYPTTVVQPSGKKVPVVQAFAYTKYLGKLHVKFDAEGNLLSFEGAPILLNASVSQDQELLDLLEVYRPNISAIGDQIVGYTRVHLEGDKICRARECNLGNLIADSMVHTRLMENKGGKYWTDAAIGLIMGGGIRSSIEKNDRGTITLRDLQNTLPYENELYLTRISGKTLRNALEHSASVWDTDSNGGFLQFSGLHVEYDLDREAGHRLVSASVLCAECYVPTYAHLNESAFYNVIITSFLLGGGDGFQLVEEHDPHTEVLQHGDIAALKQYLQSTNPVYPHNEARVVIRKSTANA